MNLSELEGHFCSYDWNTKHPLQLPFRHLPVAADHIWHHICVYISWYTGLFDPEGLSGRKLQTAEERCCTRVTVCPCSIYSVGTWYDTEVWHIERFTRRRFARPTSTVYSHGRGAKQCCVTFVCPSICLTPVAQRVHIMAMVSMEH